VEADDPARNRCGCFLPDLTRLATAPSADFRAGIWVRTGYGASRAFFIRYSRDTENSSNMTIHMLFLSILAAAAQPRPEAITVVGHAWAPFISPMGEPFGPKGERDNTLATWFRQADRNQDGVLTSVEMLADAERFFATLDSNHDGEIDPEELIHYEWQVAPAIQVNSRLRRQPGEKPDPKQVAKERRARERGDDRYGPQGASRYALLNIPQPVAAADLDLNRGVSLAEFRQAAGYRFGLLDTAHRGTLALDQLEALRLARITSRPPKKIKGAPDPRVGVPLPPGR